MRIEPAALATSIGTLTTLEPSEGFPEALQQMMDAAKLLFKADGAGLMLVGKAAGPRDWTDGEVAALQADARVVASLLRPPRPPP